MSVPYFDYRFRFTDLPRALDALAALRSAGVLGAGELPENTLGDLRDASGNTVSDASLAAWGGRKGTGAGGSDPAAWYVHIRSEVNPATLPFDPTTYGLAVTAPAESAAVLGVWA